MKTNHPLGLSRPFDQVVLAHSRCYCSYVRDLVLRTKGVVTPVLVLLTRGEERLANSGSLLV